MLKKTFAFGLLAVGTLCASALGAIASETQLGVQSIDSDNHAVGGVAVTQNEQYMDQSAWDGYSFYPDSTTQIGVQDIDSDNHAVFGAAVTQNQQYLEQIEGGF